MFCHLSSFTCAQVWSSPCAQCVLWRGGCWWWTSAVFQIVIQLLKTSCPVLPVPCQVWWWCCSASPGPLNADTLSKNTVLLWRWELPLPAVFRSGWLPLGVLLRRDWRAWWALFRPFLHGSLTSWKTRVTGTAKVNGPVAVSIFC